MRGARRVCCFSLLLSLISSLLGRDWGGKDMEGQGVGGALSLSPSKGGDVQGKPLCHSPSMELTYEIFRFSWDIISGCLDPAAAYTPSVLWASFLIFSGPHCVHLNGRDRLTDGSHRCSTANMVPAWAPGAVSRLILTKCLWGVEGVTLSLNAQIGSQRG